MLSPRSPVFLLGLSALGAACSDQGLSKVPGVPPDGGDTAEIPSIALDPPTHDFGALLLGDAASLDLTVANTGEGALDLRSLRLEGGGEYALDLREADNGPLPWLLDEGESRPLRVHYVPVDTAPDAAIVLADSNDPATPVARARQAGRARPFPGFSTGWYIVDDPTLVPTTDPAHLVNEVGDSDGYWYESSGAHGLTGTTDPVRDFATLSAWIRERSGGPVPVTGPLDLRTTSDVPNLRAATFAWVLCDFWVDPADAASTWTIAFDDVDDGARVLLDGERLGDVTYGNPGRWDLTDLAPGMVHTLVVILQDNARVDKYVVGLRFLKDGVLVTG